MITGAPEEASGGMREPLLILDDLAVGYNGLAVLSGISLSIARAGFTAILGANGSGKTTLLKTLLGLLQPVSGRIETASAEAPPAFGYVPQAARLDPIYLLTAREVAQMGAYGRIGPGRLVPPGEREFTRECLRAAGAEGFAGRRFAELSGGQKQRVLIARALAVRPDVLVLDEPTAGLDHAAALAVMAFISRLRRERAIAVVLVTHDFAAARRHADEILWLHEGKALHGPARELLTPERMTKILEDVID
jgi:zinc/manganese transport system ATP-binding protein